MMRIIIRASLMKNYFETQHSLYLRDDNYAPVLEGENVSSDMNEDDGNVESAEFVKLFRLRDPVHVQ